MDDVCFVVAIFQKVGVSKGGGLGSMFYGLFRPDDYKLNDSEWRYNTVLVVAYEKPFAFA